MNKEIAEQWVAELKSGKYPKGKGKLHRQGAGYCCLGVLCELATKSGVPVVVEILPKDEDDCQVAYSGCRNYLPRCVLEWAGMRTDHGAFMSAISFQPLDVTATSSISSISNLNDQVDSWEPIIKAIEEHVEEL